MQHLSGRWGQRRLEVRLAGSLREVGRRLGYSHVERGLLRALPVHRGRFIDNFYGALVSILDVARHKGKPLISAPFVLVLEAVRQLNRNLLLLS